VLIDKLGSMPANPLATILARVLLLSCAANAAITRFPNENNVYGVPAAGSTKIPLLGLFNTTAECESAVLSYKNAACQSYTFHTTKFHSPFSKKCYCHIDKVWTPQDSQNINSGWMGLSPLPPAPALHNCTRGPCGPGNEKCVGRKIPQYQFHLSDDSCGINDPVRT
jgi:hypothetical protein